MIGTSIAVSLENSKIFIMVLIGLLTFILTFRRPIWGLYASYFLLWAMPPKMLRLDIPVFFHSPLNIVALITALSAVVNFIS